MELEEGRKERRKDGRKEAKEGKKDRRKKG